MIANDSVSDGLLETRRTEHKLRLGLEGVPLCVIQGSNWRETTGIREGPIIVETLVHLDDVVKEESGLPGRHQIVEVLSRQFAFVYHPKSQPDHPDFPLRWSGGGPLCGPRRAWFVVSHEPLELDTLTAHMVERHYPGARKKSLLLVFPVLRPALSLSRVGASVTEVAGETERIVLKGVEADTILALRDGRDVEAVAAALSEHWSAEEVHFALSRLRARGLIEEAGARFSDWEEDFWRAAGVDRVTAARRLAETVIAVHGPPAMCQAMSRWGIELAAEGQREPTAELVVVEDYLQGDHLDAVNRRALASGRPWVLAKVTGRMAWIGPAIRPGETACWACLEWRLRENRATALGPGSPSPVSMAAVDLVAAEVARWLARDGGWLEGRMFTFDTWSMTHRSHSVHRRAHCLVCGTPPASPQEPAFAMPKLVDECEHPVALESTVGRLRRLVSPLTGLIPELREMPGAGPFTVYYSRLNAALGSKANAAGLRNDPWQALGKSQTRLQAEVGCLAEAVERYSSGFHPGEPLVTKRWRDWADGEAVHPSCVVLYSERQWRGRAAWNAQCGRSNMVFARFDEEQPAEWMQVWSLSQDRARWMVADLCFIDYPSEPPRQFCLGDSNGCAAGNTKAEALLRALLELIERDAVAIWWYNRLQRPSVSPAVLSAPAVDGGRRLLAERGRELAVLDITNDLKIPAAVAVSWRQREGDQVLLGFAADLTQERAAGRAVDELCQLLPWPGEQIGDCDWARWWKNARIEVEPWLLPSPAATIVAAPPIPPQSVGAVAEIERRLSAGGLETLACDLTRADAGFPVVRAIVPGLRHFHAHLGPGRLYDVPVQLGWLRAPVREEEMNNFLFPL